MPYKQGLMKNIKERIFIKQWLELKPYSKQVKSDSYYLKLSNDVKEAIMNNKESFALQMFLDKEGIDLLSCFLTSYFEDLISGTNIWNTFVKNNIHHYKKPLPFYDVDEYYEEEINVHDISFLIWYFLNTIQHDKIISPLNEFITRTAENVYDVFDASWDTAPENESIKSFYTIGENETNYYLARNLIDTILFKTYLFYPDTFLDLHDSELELLGDKDLDDQMISYLSENRDNTLLKVHTRLSGISGKEWASKLIGESHPLYNDFLNISTKIRGYFLYKGQDEQTIFIEHIASGKKFSLIKESFQKFSELKEIDTILFMGIVRWRNKWWFSGIFAQMPFNPDLVLDEKNSFESRLEVSFLDNQPQDMQSILEKQSEAFKKTSKGAPIVFLKSDNIESFIQKYTINYNKLLMLSDEDSEKASKRAKEEGFFGGASSSSPDLPESALIFFNPQRGIEVALDVNSAFPVPENSFFDPENSKLHILQLLADPFTSKELAMYCIDNFKSKLPFFQEPEGRLYLSEIDFLLRFWKKEHYVSEPAIAFTGNPQK